MKATFKFRHGALLKNLIVLIPVFIGLLYLHGESYRAGYLGYWGLPSELFKLGFEDTIAQGGVAYLITGFFVLLVTLLAAFSVSMMAKIINDFTKFSFIQSFLGRVKNQTINEVSGHPVSESILKTVVFLTVRIAAVFLTLLLILSMFQVVNNDGIESARNQHTKLANSKVKSVIHYEDEKLVGHIIVCGEQFCAALIEGNVMVMPNKSINGISKVAPTLKEVNTPR